MKKVIALVLALVCVLGVVGCSADNYEQPVVMNGILAEVTEVIDDGSCKVVVTGKDNNFDNGDNLTIHYNSIQENSEKTDKQLEKGDIIAVTYSEYEEIDGAYIISVEYVSLQIDIAHTEVETIDYPPMVMLNDILYTATSYSGDKKDFTVVGKIESCIDYGVPTENNQANDTLVGCEIYTTSSAPDFIFVLNNGVYSPYKSTDEAGIE